MLDDLFKDLQPAIASKFRKVAAMSPPPAKQALEAWLAGVYELRGALKRLGEEEEGHFVKSAAKLVGVSKNTDIYKLLVEVTSGTHVCSRNKSRYAAALSVLDA